MLDISKRFNKARRRGKAIGLQLITDILVTVFVVHIKVDELPLTDVEQEELGMSKVVVCTPGICVDTMET